MEGLEEFLAKYGERGYALLKAILEASLAPRRGPGFGDFSFKEIKARLASYGLNYNPSVLLAKLEKEYGVIETSYRSGTQHWWRIVDRRVLEEAVKRYEGGHQYEDDPRIKVLRVQFASLDPFSLLKELEKLSRSRRLSSRDIERFRELAFNTLPLIARFLEEAKEFEDTLEYEVKVAEEILDAAERIAVRLTSERLKNPLLNRLSKPIHDGFESG